MLEDLLECSKNDDDLIAFLLEYANYFDEKDLETIKDIQEKVNQNLDKKDESYEVSNNSNNIISSEYKSYVIDDNIENNENIVSNIYKELSVNNSNNINASNNIDKIDIKFGFENGIEPKKIIRLKAKPNTVIHRRNRVLVHKIVKDGIETHINPICVKLYKKLLDKNIFIKDISVDNSRIRITFDKLSIENELIYNESCQIHPRKYKKIGNNYVLEIQRENKSDSVLKNELVKSMRFLKMQDVQIGFIDKKRFLMNFCDCEKVEGHTDLEYNKNIKIIFDESKMEKTFEDYLVDKKFDRLYSLDDNKVYLDEYYLNAHLRYLSYMNNTNNQESNIDNTEINDID